MAGKIFPYLKEFNAAKKEVIKSRLRLFCGLTIILYLAISILAILLDPSAFRKTEMIVWAFLIAVAVAVLLVNHRAETLPQAKLNAAIFAVSLVIAAAALFFIYPEYTMQSSEVFALTTFLISFIIPWEALEVMIIGLIHLIGYSAVYIRAAWGDADPESIIYAQGGYIDGLIFLLAAVVICAVIRKRDCEREKKGFAMMQELEKKNQQMANELAIAREVQKTLIPKSMSTPDAEIAVSYIPLSTVGGDYATFHITKDGGLFFLIGDVTGHGVPAALLVNRVYGEVESLVTKNPDPGSLMRDLDAFVQEHFEQTQMYFTVCSGLINFRDRALFYSNYGHPPQILLRRSDSRICLLESQTYFLGIEDGGAGRKIFEGRAEFDRKDRIVLFTDGLIETAGSGGSLYGMERLKAFVRGHTGDNPAVFNANLLAEIDGFREGPVTDDTFLVTIDIK